MDKKIKITKTGLCCSDLSVFIVIYKEKIKNLKVYKHIPLNARGYTKDRFSTSRDI
jgi:hypothetical protein